MGMRSKKKKKKEKKKTPSNCFGSYDAKAKSPGPYYLQTPLATRTTGPANLMKNIYQGLFTSPTEGEAAI